MPRSASVQKSNAKLFSKCESSLKECDGGGKWDKKHLGGEETMRGAEGSERMPDSQPLVTLRYIEWSQMKLMAESLQQNHLEPSPGMTKSLESEDASGRNSFMKSEKRNCCFAEPDPSSAGRVLEEFGNLGEVGEGPSPSASSARVAATRGWERGTGGPEGSQRQRPHGVPSREPSKLDVPISSKCQIAQIPVAGPESQPVKDTVLPSYSFPTPSQTSPPVSAAGQNLAAWVEEILNTYLGTVEDTGDRLYKVPGSVGSALGTCGQVLGGDCGSTRVLLSHPSDKTRTRLDIVITLAREGGHAAGLVSADTGDTGERRGGAGEVQMAESGSFNPGKPAEQVESPSAEECRRYVANFEEPPLAGFNQLQAPGTDQPSPPPPPVHGHISPRLSPRDPGFSRFLQQPPIVRASSKPDRQKPARLPEPLQEVGGLIVSCNRVEGDTKIMSTNNEVGPQTDQHLSSHAPSPTAGFPHAESSTVHQNGDGLSESARQTSKEDLKNKVYEVFIKDEMIVNGSDPAETKENSHQKVVPLSYSPTLSDDVGHQSKVDSLTYIRTIGCDRTQESIEAPQCDEADALQTANSTGRTQQMNTLYPQSPDQNGLFAEAVTPPKYELSASGTLKLDSVPQSVESSLFNPQQGSRQNALNFPTDSVNVHGTEMPAHSSQSLLLQKPMEIAKDINLESCSVVKPGSQAQTLKLDESTGEGNSGQELHPSGVELIDYQLSLNDVFFQNKIKKSLPNAIDEPDSQSEIDGFVDTIRNLDVPILLNRNRNSRIQRSHSLTSPVPTLPPIEEDQTDSKFFPSSSITEGPQQPAEPVAIDEILESDSPIQPVLEIPKVDFTKRLTKKESLTPGQMMMQFKEKPKIGVARISAENSIVFQSSLSGRVNVDGTANSEDTEALNGNGLRSRFSNSVLFSTYRTPVETFSSRSLDLSLGSVTKSRVSAPPTTTQNSVQRSWSQEDIPTTTIALDKLSTPNFLSNRSVDAGTGSLPFSISERLLPGYSRLSDSGRDLRTQKMSQPSEKKPGKMTAFPDSWKTKPKEHEHINPRPGKIVIYDKQNFTGVRREISCDVTDCSTWQFPAIISIKIIRGCWVLYEEPDYKGKKIFLAEEDIELMDPWGDQMEEEMVEKETEDQEPEPPPTKPIVIGSLRRAVRDYSTPQISLFSEVDGEGKKMTFYGESEDIRIFGYPPKITSIIVNAGLWLVYSEPFFEGKQHALELGGYRTLQEWGAEKAQVGSLIPLQMGGPRVENPHETKLIVFERAYFGGKSREVHGDSTDFLSRYPNNGALLSNAGSIKVYGGIWVGYSKEGFRGHQYLMEEGEYLDWRSWGGHDEDLKSLRVIRTDFSNPMIILYPGGNCDGENSIEAIASVPDLDQDDTGEIIQSINVLSGAWVAYEGANYSGAQYIVEKGLYRNLQEWGAQNCKIASLHPILLVESNDHHFSLKIQIFSETNFTGRSLVIEEKKMGIPKEFKLQSCRVLSGSWALYEGQDYDGRVFVVSEGEYPDLPSMGCRMTTHIRCVKAIPHVFSQSLITLHGLENFEGKEIELDSEVKDLVSDGYNNMVLSLHVIGGVWVIYEYSNFRGRQVLLEPIEISNWPKYSSFTRIGSIMPIAQKRAFFNVKNKETGDLLSVLPSEDDVKSGRVIVAPVNKELEQLWFFEKGLLKPKFAPDVSLQTIGTLADTGSKVVLWTETRIPRHCWTFEFSGTIRSLLYEGFVLDIKGGKSYDRDAAMICKYEEQNPVQQWEIQML